MTVPGSRLLDRRNFLAQMAAAGAAAVDPASLSGALPAQPAADSKDIAEVFRVYA
jgi:hypothetical protein